MRRTLSAVLMLSIALAGCRAKEAYDKAMKDRETSMKKNKELNDAFVSGRQRNEFGRQPSPCRDR